MVDILARALLSSYSEVDDLQIENFEIGKFYSDLKNLFSKREWLSETANFSSDKVSMLPKNDRTFFSSEEKMSESSFWELIENARVDSKFNLNNQIKIITDRLSKKDGKEIIGFECTLRELLMRAYHFNVMAVQKIIEGNIEDDSFLYFRCKLILYGRNTYGFAINNPNQIIDRIDSIVSGEALLNISETAFKMKFKENSLMVSPREYASEIIDYDFGEFKVQGIEWLEEDIPKRYYKLWKTYQK